MANPLTRFHPIRTLLFDVDGVMTDSRILVTEEGHLLRTMSVRDGYAIKRALEAGLRVGVITGGSSKGVAQRLAALGVTDVFSGVIDKLEVARAYMQRHALSRESVLYMGDDIPDIPVMREVGLPCCPGDATPEVIAEARYISAFSGGDGCVRDVIEKVLRVQNLWELQ